MRIFTILGIITVAVAVAFARRMSGSARPKLAADWMEPMPTFAFVTPIPTENMDDWYKFIDETQAS